MQVRKADTDAALAELTSRIGGHVRMLRRGRGMSRRVLSDVSVSYTHLTLPTKA